MDIFREVRTKVDAADWRCRPHYGGFDVRPTDTFKDIVSTALVITVFSRRRFNPAESSWRTANRYSLREMYHPTLGEYRQRKEFSTLSPSNGMPYEDRNAARYFGPYRTYEPKKSAWKYFYDKFSSAHLYPKHCSTPEHKEEPMHLKSISRRLNEFPTSTSRVQNYDLYWRGRLDGVFGTGALFYADNFEGREDRRYNRIYWGQNWMDYITPSARHATSFLLTAY